MSAIAGALLTKIAALGKLPEIAVAKLVFRAFKKYEQQREQEAQLEFLSYLTDQVGDIAQLHSDAWVQSEEGRRYWEKVLGAALDSQAAGKRRYFAFALANGVRRKDLGDPEKLFFVDVLRKLSLPALAVLSAMHSQLGPLAGKQSESTAIVDSNWVEMLSDRFEPFTIEAAIQELNGSGIFSNTRDWRQGGDGKWHAGGAYSNRLAYTRFTCEFVRFISETPAQLPGL